VTKLLIYRGETLHAELPLTDKTIRIGRSAQNEVVLEDPGKGVSRTHAEIRPEGGGYRLVDLDSQNGIWVHGKRESSVRLDPGVIAAVGPFRLSVETVGASEAITGVLPEVVPDTGTEFIRPPSPSPLSVPPAAPVPVEGAGSLLDGPASVPSPKGPPPAAAPLAPRSPVASREPRVSGGTTPSSRSSQPRTMLMAGAAVLLIAASGFGAYVLIHRMTAKPAWNREAAIALVTGGKCQQALDQQINPALRADPNNPEALGLKQQCTAPTPAPAPAPPSPPPAPTPAPKTNTQKLDDAEAALTAHDCQVALDTSNAVLTDDANDERARALVAKANTCLKPTPAPTPVASETAAAKLAPAQGGLDAQTGETQKEYTKRVQGMHKRYDDAVTLLQGQHYQQALKEFDAIATVVPPGYIELAQRRAEARGALKDESNRAYVAGQQAEQHADWNLAIERYQHAHEVDPSRDVTSDMTRVNDQKLRLGHDACSAGDANYLVAHNTAAAAQYAQAVALLPPSDPCYATAKQRLAEIRK
jgi:predicted component of type VI protein secretion system